MTAPLSFPGLPAGRVFQTDADGALQPIAAGPDGAYLKTAGGLWVRGSLSASDIAGLGAAPDAAHYLLTMANSALPNGHVLANSTTVAAAIASGTLQLYVPDLGIVTAKLGNRAVTAAKMDATGVTVGYVPKAQADGSVAWAAESGGTGGSSSGIYNPNGITGTPSALDDDWSSGTIGAKWTQLNWPPTSVSVNSRKPGYLWVKQAGRASSHLLATICQPLPAGDASLSVPINHSGTPNSISLSGLIFMSGNTTAASHFIVGIGTEPDWYRCFIQSGANLSSITNNIVTPIPRGGNPQWIVTVRRATSPSTTWTAEFSTEGRTVHEVAFTAPIAPTYVGLTGSPYNATYQATFGAFRYSNSLTTLFGTYT